MSGNHKKIRFKKHDFQKLHHLPSSVSPDGMKLRSPWLRAAIIRWLRRGLYCVIAFGVLFALLVAVLLKVGISGDLLASKMQTALRAELGNVAKTHINDAHLSLDENYHIALEARDVLLDEIKGGVEINKIGILRLGLATRPLLKGNIKVAQLELQDSEIILPQSQGGSFMDKLPQDSVGRVDLDAISDLLFTSLDGLIASFDSQSTNSLVLNNVSFHFLVKGEDKTLTISHLELRNYRSSMIYKAKMDWEGQTLVAGGRVTHSSSRLAEQFVFHIENIPLHFGAAENASPYLPDGRPNNAYFRSTGLGNVSLQGQRATAQSEQKLDLIFGLTNAGTDIGLNHNIVTAFELNAEHRKGSGKVEILPSEFILGSLYIPFNGAFGPVPLEEMSEDVQDKYRFEIISNDAATSPADTGEPRTDFVLKLAGDYAASQKRATFQELTVRTKKGALMGQGSLQFGIGSPEAVFVLHVPKMPVDDVKQLWPINVAPSARHWIVTHIFGGEVSEGLIEIALPEGFFKAGKVPPLLTEKELRINATINDARADLVGELPALRDSDVNVRVRGTTTEVDVPHALAYVSNNEKLSIFEGHIVIPWRPKVTIFADLSLRIKGKAQAIGKLVTLKPINAGSKIPFAPEDANGEVSGLAKVRFPIGKNPDRSLIDWSADVDFANFSLAKPIGDSIHVSAGSGKLKISKAGAEILADAQLNDIPAKIDIARPGEGADFESREKITLNLGDDIRKKIMPGLNDLLSGPILVEVGPQVDGMRHLSADITKAVLSVPWAGWKKGNGVPAKVEMTFNSAGDDMKSLEIKDLSVKGSTFHLAGNLTIKNGQLSVADFKHANLNRDDDLQLHVQKTGHRYRVKATGGYADLRAYIKQLGNSNTVANTKDALDITISMDRVGGFNNEVLDKFKVSYSSDGKGNEDIAVASYAASKGLIDARIGTSDNIRNIHMAAADAGALLRFMDYYDKVQGGKLEVTLRSVQGGSLTGPILLENFQIVNEPKLASIVSNTPSTGGKSLNDAVKGKIDASRVAFDRAFGHITKGSSFLALDKGVVRGQTVGATFQGILYDSYGNMSMTGTFMPAYGINRLFGDVPILGAVLGNGRDHGLIGITFKIEGNAKKPRVVVNPISAIAPGIFRQIFEFQQ